MPTFSPQSIDVQNLGVLGYKQGIDLQLSMHEKVRLNRAPDTIIALQHSNVITFGKNSKTEFLLAPSDRLKQMECELVQSDRGGEVTAHMPGQLVVYPIIHLSKRRLMPKQYVCKLEQGIIDTLATFGIQSSRDPLNPGVWVGQNKIAAIGVRIKDQVSMHGLALNVSNSFELYEMIVPCGISGRGVTSMTLELGHEPEFEAVTTRLTKKLRELIWQ